MADNPAKIVDAVRKAPGTRVKVAVSDIDGILRGKYIHKEKFASAVEGGFGFCDVVFGWDSHDGLQDLRAAAIGCRVWLRRSIRVRVPR